MLFDRPLIPCRLAPYVPLLASDQAWPEAEQVMWLTEVLMAHEAPAAASWCVALWAEADVRFGRS